MLSVLLAIVLTGIAVPECAEPLLSYIYDAQDYRKICRVCADRITIQTESYGVEQRATRSITLPDLSEAVQAIQAAPTEEICDGPMDVAGTEYWLHSQPPVLFSAAGSACWVQSAAPQAASTEALVDALCGGVAWAP